MKAGKRLGGRQTLSCKSNMLFLQNRVNCPLISAFDGVDPEEGSRVTESDDVGDGAEPVVFLGSVCALESRGGSLDEERGGGDRARQTFPCSPGVKESW